MQRQANVSMNTDEVEVGKEHRYVGVICVTNSDRKVWTESRVEQERTGGGLGVPGVCGKYVSSVQELRTIEHQFQFFCVKVNWIKFHYKNPPDI